MERKCKSLNTLTHPTNSSSNHAGNTNVELMKPILKLSIIAYVVSSSVIQPTARNN